MRVAVVGGTGDFGLALAQRLIEVSFEVVIGSRDASRARDRASAIGAAKGVANEDAVTDVDLVVLATKADAALGTAGSLKEALGETPLLSVASELRFTKHGVLPTDNVQSIAERLQESLRSPVAAGLHSLAAAALADGPTDGDAFICGDDERAKHLALELAAHLVAGRALDAGPLGVARALEGMTAVIVNLNRRHRSHAGVCVTGLA